MQKCYNVTVTGKVQDIGFRNLIEDLGRYLGLSGYVFNAADGSVKLVCWGENNVITRFFKEIQISGVQKGAVIEDIEKEEIPFLIFLPEKFSKLCTDELVDIGRKLDTGNDELKGVNKKLSSVDGKLSGIDGRLLSVDGKLSGIDGRLLSVDERLSGIGEETHNLNTVMGFFVTEQKEHNQHLERILEKLAEKGVESRAEK